MTLSLVLAVAVVIGFSFYSMRNAYLNTFSIYNETLLQQTTDRMTSFHERMLGVYQAASQNVVLREYLSNTSLEQSRRAVLLNSFLSSWTPMIQSGTDLGKIIFLGSNGSILTLGDYSSRQLEESALKEYSENISDVDGVAYLYSDDGFFTDGNPVPAIVVVKHLPKRRDGKPFGTMFVILQESGFAELYSAAYGENSSIVILDDRGLVISSDRKETVGTYLRELNSVLSDAPKLHEVSLEGRKYLTISSKLSALHLRIVSLVDQGAILKRLLSAFPAMCAICVLIVSVAAMLIYSVSSRMNRELGRLMRHMGKGQTGKLKKIDPTGGDPEIRSLEESFNSMTEELDQYIVRLRDEQKNLRESEIRTLQAQINPHFLYNTLASIKFLAWQDNTKAVSEVVDALTLLLRSTVGATEREETVRAELEVLQSYTCIARWRYGDDINVVIDAEEDCLDAALPRMIVQPFLENAFFHAYQKKKSGTVQITFSIREAENNADIYKEDAEGNEPYAEIGRLTITISDDGDGMPQEDAEKLLIQSTEGPHFTGMGIRNVHERLMLLYGDEAKVQVESAPGEGTRIEISFPFRKAGCKFRDDTRE